MLSGSALIQPHEPPQKAEEFPWPIIATCFWLNKIVCWGLRSPGWRLPIFSNIAGVDEEAVQLVPLIAELEIAPPRSA